MGSQQAALIYFLLLSNGGFFHCQIHFAIEFVAVNHHCDVVLRFELSTIATRRATVSIKQMCLFGVNHLQAVFCDLIRWCCLGRVVDFERFSGRFCSSVLPSFSIVPMYSYFVRKINACPSPSWISIVRSQVSPFFTGSSGRHAYARSTVFFSDSGLNSSSWRTAAVFHIPLSINWHSSTCFWCRFRS